MSETANYQLHLTDDRSESFLSASEKMSGINPDSNMQIIDRVLGEKADSSVPVYAVLLSNAWTGINPPFTQTLVVEGLTATQNGTISIAHDATMEQREIAREAMLAVVGQEDGKLIIAADGEMPERDIPVYIILLG